MMEVPSPSKDRDGELDLEDVWSELHALRKLYGLLQKSSVDTNNHSNSEDRENLDDKSRHLLKKLLDGATHQALQSQAKIVFSTPQRASPSPKTPPETTNTSNGVTIREDEIIDSPQKLQNCHQTVGREEQADSSSPQAESTPVEPNKALESSQNPCPTPDQDHHHLKLQTSVKKSMTAINYDQKSLRHRHRHRSIDRSSKTRTLRTSTAPKDHSPDQAKKNQEKVPLQTNDLVVGVPAHKRARLVATSRTRVEGRADRELTHSKRSGLASESSRVRGLAERQRSIKSREKNKSTELDQRKKNGTDQEKKLSRQKKPSRERVMKPSAAARDPVDRNPKNHPPRIPKRTKSMRYSRLSRSTTRSDCSSSRETSCTPTSDSTPSEKAVVRRTKAPTCDALVPTRTPAHRELRHPPPRRMLSHHQAAGPHRRGADKSAVSDHKKERSSSEKREGKLKRFKNKLAVIFHHHHHHHIHDGHVAIDGGAELSTGVHHGTPWKFLRNILPNTSKADHRKLKAAVARAPAQHQHGYMYSLLEGLIRHVWGLRNRKKVLVDRGRFGKSKKLHWWQRLRRRGGFKLAGRKKPRLKLGFNRSRSRTARK